MCRPDEFPPYVAVSVAFQRTRIDPPVNTPGGCWRCGRRNVPVVAGYYCGGGRSASVPWRPVCEACDRSILADPSDAFAAGLYWWLHGVRHEAPAPAEVS